MDIKVKFSYNGDPVAYPHQPFTLNENQASLVAKVGDLVRNGMMTKVVTGRVFEYGKDEVTVTLICEN